MPYNKMFDCGTDQLDQLNRSQRQKCGEVYSTWSHSGQSCIIKCTLCEDRPLCTLIEFSEHMEVWHSDWNDDHLERYANEIDVDEVSSSHQNDFEPFEEVLIAIEAEEQTKSINIDQQSELIKASLEECSDDDNVSIILSNTTDEDTEILSECEYSDVERQSLISLEAAAGSIVENKSMCDSADVEPYADNSETVSINVFVTSKAGSTKEKSSESFENNTAYVCITDDSGVERSEVSSATASTTLSGSDDGDNETKSLDQCTVGERIQFGLDEPVPDVSQLNVGEQIRFGLDEPVPKPKLSTAHMEKLIELYQTQPRLWQVTHPENNNLQLCRESWLEITYNLNKFCQLEFSTNDIRVRISTLRQRYIKERKRREMEKEFVEPGLSSTTTPTRFRYFKHLKFLDSQHQAPHKLRVVHLAQQNSKLLELYAHFPLLWHNAEKRRRCAKARDAAFASIAAGLKQISIHLPTALIRQRLLILKKRYHKEKLRHLHCQLDQKTFESHFHHYEEMQFLDEHIAPYVCKQCGKIFKELTKYQMHMKHVLHGIEADSTKSIDVAISANEAETLKTATSTANEQDLSEEIQMAVEVMEEMLTNSNHNEVIELCDIENNEDITTMDAEGPKSIRTTDKIDLNFVHTSETALKTFTTSQVRQIESEDFNYAPFVNSKGVEANSKSTTTLRRLTEAQAHVLIALYREHPQLWDPEHINYNSQRIRRIAWRSLTTKLNQRLKTNFTWLQLQRKMMDYVKYYKREKQRIQSNSTCTQWNFYDDFRFLDEALLIASDLRNRIQQRDQILKIIEVYEAHSQLWDTTHPQHTKRNQRQRTIALMCARLQEVHNISIEHEKLKQKLLDLRCNYRTTKLARIAAEKRNEAFTPASQFEFYEVLQFLEAHVAPFSCQTCQMSFERFTDYTQHQRKEHQRKKRKTHPLLANDIDKNTLENICHICGIKFTLRHNLIQHLNRHFGERTLACSECGKKFFTNSSLRDHERIHTKVPAVICPECGHTFVNASKLNQHMKRHRNQRDYPCDQCDKAFYTAFERERHVRRHLNIRDKICTVCGKAFVAGSAYYTHIKLHNEKKEYVCTACNMEFSQYAGLYKHRKKHHPNNCN